MTGEIPSNIGNLINLERLDLDRNYLTGEIPSSIGDLSNLNILFLWNNQLTGEIPPSIGNLSNLHILVVGDNQLSGEIPNEICNIDINPVFDNYNWTPEIFNGNSLCPPYPECIQNYVDIEPFGLSGGQDITNCFSCDDDDVYELWGTYYHAEYTTSINLANNGLIGEIPQELENFVNLEYLALRDNNLSGLVGDFICDIEEYTLNNNSLCGPFPDCIDVNSIFPQQNSSECEEYCNNNTQVDLWGFCYEIDETTQISLNNSELSGEIPSSIGGLINLERLYLNENQLTGSIPVEIGELTNLTHLYLSDNQLSGQIPIEICEQGDSSPDLENNNLCPPYPDCILEHVGSQNVSECVE